MANITDFPDILSAVHGQYGTDVRLKATTAISCGQVVQQDASETDGSIETAPAAASAGIVGVALQDIPAGTYGTVRVVGTAQVANGDDGTAIKPGTPVVVAGLAGCVKAYSSTLTTAAQNVVGYAVELIPGGGTGVIAILPYVISKGAA
jgi:hypothetical protein